MAANVNLRMPPNEGAVKTRVLRAEHLVAIALRVGRPKDSLRIIQFLEEAAVNIAALCGVIASHGLRDAWLAFCSRAGIADPCKV